MKSNIAGRLLRVVERSCALLSAFAIALIMVALLADTIARYIFGGSLPGISNFASEYLLIIAIYFSLAYTWSVGQHASVALVPFERWSWAPTLLRAVNLVVTVSVLLVVVYANFQALQSAQTRGTVSAGGVPFAIWPAYLLICIGSALFLGVVVARLGKPRIRSGQPIPEEASSAKKSAGEEMAR